MAHYQLETLQQLLVAPTWSPPNVMINTAVPVMCPQNSTSTIRFLNLGDREFHESYSLHLQIQMNIHQDVDSLVTHLMRSGYTVPDPRGTSGPVIARTVSQMERPAAERVNR